MIAASGGLDRLIQILLPSGGMVTAMFEGYFDESGDLEVAPKIFCVSGYFILTDAALAMDREWAKVLDDHKIPYFHMVDCAHGNGVFSGKSKDERAEIVKKLIGLIKKYTLEGFSVIAREELFEASEETPDVYSYGVEMSVYALQVFLKVARTDGDMAFIFESGHKSKGRAYSSVADKVSSLSASLTFHDKQKVRLLQAADLLAWQCSKYIKDRVSGARPPRKDFMSLMEHDHSFFHVSIKNGQKSMGLEAWPLSKRSPTSAQLTMNSDGPITFFTEDGEGIPIIPVMQSMGWRMGGARMAYLGFTAMGDKKFALAFDDMRLLEAIMSLIRATDIYADEKRKFSIPANNVSAEVVGDAVALTFKITGGGSVAFRLSKDEFERLKNS